MRHLGHQLSAARLLTWAAWAPDRTDREGWQRWARGEERRGSAAESVAAAPCRDVPALLRRRCSTLTRMTMEVAFGACAQSEVLAKEVTMVYCSRHGEMGVLRQLLDDLFAGQPLSPTHFSNSVHHSATGYFDLAAGNRLPSRTLSGGEANLVCGYLEALGMLRQWPSRACLLLFGDEGLPEPFRTELDRPTFPYAIGFMLAREEVGEGTVLGFRRESGRGEPAPPPTASGCADEDSGGDAVLDFLRWLECDDRGFSLPTRFGTWTWNK